MSVNIYDPELDELHSLTSMFATPVVIDVKELPTIGIDDVIYRVASDSWSLRSVELSATDMAINTASLEGIGCTTSIAGDIYTYTPSANYVRYWACNEVYAVSSIEIDSTTGEMTIIGADGSTILLQTTIETGLYPFYISQKWSNVSVTLSHTDMATNTTNLTSIGFGYTTDTITYTYKPKNCRFKYNNSEITKIVITAADGNMKIYDDSDTIIYNQIITDGQYNFLKASAVTYWVGNKQSQKAEQLATINDVGSTAAVSSLQDIFNTSAVQNVIGPNNVMSFANSGSKVSVKANEIELSHDVSGTQQTDVKINATKITLSNTIRDELKKDLDVCDVIEGYYNPADDKFYEESTYTTEITGTDGKIYISLDTEKMYRYNETDTEYILLGAPDAIEYVNVLPAGAAIQNVIYGTITRMSYSDTIVDGFLDDNSLFDKEEGSDKDYTYTAAEGLEIEASTDDVNYKKFQSLAYDGVSEWTLTYADYTDETLADEDTFYFRQINRVFYAGNAEAQIVTPFANAGGGSSSAYYPGEGISITNRAISVTPATTADIGGIKPDGSTTVTNASGVLSGNYQGGYGVKVDGNEISSSTFVGTQSDWNALTPAEQAEFDTVSITDDGTSINNTPGHIVQNDTTAFPPRTNLKFADATITDDSANDATIVSHTPYTAGDKIDITNHVVSCDETVKGTFIGTKDEWNALIASEKAKYDVVNFTDDQSEVTTVVDTVVDGNMNAVTSNAVYDALQANKNSQIKIATAFYSGQITINDTNLYLKADVDSSVDLSGKTILGACVGNVGAYDGRFGTIDIYACRIDSDPTKYVFKALATTTNTYYIQLLIFYV